MMLVFDVGFGFQGRVLKIRRQYNSINGKPTVFSEADFEVGLSAFTPRSRQIIFRLSFAHLLWATSVGYRLYPSRGSPPCVIFVERGLSLDSLIPNTMQVFFLLFPIKSP